MEWQEKHKEAKASDLQVELVPAAKVKRTSTGLLLAVKITNHSPQDILVKLAYEKGTIRPVVYASVTPEQAARAGPFQRSSSSAKPRTRPAAEATIAKGSHSIWKRLWIWPRMTPGGVNPPLEPTVAWKLHQLRLVLVFQKPMAALQYVVSAAKTVERTGGTEGCPAGLSARIVIRVAAAHSEVVPGENGHVARPNWSFTNDSDKPLRLCPFCGPAYM